MIEIKSVTKKYGDFTAIENINTTVNNGSVLGVIGFNGSGKTTLLNICAGIFKADNGGVYFDGADTYDNNKERMNMFYLSDNLYFPPSATIKSAGKFYASYYPSFDKKILNSICELFGLKISSSIRSLSKGMKKQAALAIAFASRPKYMLIDETFDGLDPHRKEILKKLMLEYINETDASIIIASHDLAEISGVCDKVVIINGKKIILDCAIDDISNHYRRVCLTFPQPVDSQIFNGINYRKLKISGSTVYLTVCGDVEKEMEKLHALGASNTETSHLTLEEVFIEETEAESENEKIRSLFK